MKLTAQPPARGGIREAIQMSPGAQLDAEPSGGRWASACHAAGER